jgi:hypothetical protein
MFRRGSSAMALAGLILCSCGRSDRDPSTSGAPGGATSGASGATDIGQGSVATDTVTGPEIATASDGSETGIRKYDLKSGVVRYSNSILKRDQIFYFEDYGRKEALYDVIPEGGVPSGAEPYYAIIHADGKRQMFDLQKHTGSVSKLTKEPGAILGTIPDVWNNIPIIKKAREAEDLPPREFLGKEAEGYRFQATGNAGTYKVWLWKRVPLYAEIQLDEVPLHLEATSIEPDIPVPAEKFSPPSNIIFALE